MKKSLIGFALAAVLAACTPCISTPPTITTTTITSSTTTTTTSTAPTSGNDKFTIVGRDIVDPDGNIFYPIGANVAARVGNFENGYVFNWNGTATDHSQDVLNWGWNTVRINDICNPPADPGVNATNDGIDKFIDEYTAKKIVVMVDCHDVTGANPTSTSTSMTPLYAMLERLAHKYKDNPYVWFNIPNEPLSSDSSSAWLELHKSIYSRLRAIAPYNIMVADIPVYGQEISTLLDGSILPLGQGKCNVLYSWHTYGAVSDYYSNFDELKSRAAHKAALEYFKANNIPVVIGEFGDPLTLSEGTAGPARWNRIGANAVLDYAPENGVGLLWWHATGDSGNFLTYSLMADRHQAPWSAALTGEGLSATGQKFWQISHNKPNLGKYTGNYSGSNCE